MSHVLSAALFGYLLAASPAAHSESAIDAFIEETGVREGPVASGDLPGWRSPQKILVRDIPAFTAGISETLPGVEFVLVDSVEEAERHAADADVIIGFCKEDLLAAAPAVAWIQIYWAGVERCLEAESIASGRILLTNMQKMSSPTIGEHAIAMMLSLTRGLTAFGKAMEQGVWDRGAASRYGMQSIEDETILIVGLGGIGRAVAQRAAALGMRVTATRNSSRKGPRYVDYVGLSDELNELAAQADVIVNALPLTPATEALFDRELFDAAKEGTYFINVGRGKTVVTADLVAALEGGRVAGAGLDVTDPEPLPAGHVLWQMQNVIITPHVASSGQGRKRHKMLLHENLRRYAAGEALLNVVDPQRGY